MSPCIAYDTQIAKNSTQKMQVILSTAFLLGASHTYNHSTQISEDRRRKIIGYEKLLLETLCFDFQLQHPYDYIVKFVKWIQGIDHGTIIQHVLITVSCLAYQELDGKLLAQRAYIIAVDR